MIRKHPNEFYRNWDGVYVMNGMVKDFDGQEVYSYYDMYTPSRHLSVVFNLFVMF
jgi:hypothetical protein